MDVTRLRKQIGMVFQKANPFPMSIYDNIALRTAHPRYQESREARRHRGALTSDAARWDEVKDRLNKKSPWASPAASSRGSA